MAKRSNTPARFQNISQPFVLVCCLFLRGKIHSVSTWYSERRRDAKEKRGRRMMECERSPGATEKDENEERSIMQDAGSQPTSDF